MFKIQEKGKPETAVWLREDPVIIANDGNGDLHFDATTPDAARVKVLFENEKPYLADMTFNQPIFINEQPIPPGSKRPLQHGDQIQIGNSRFEISNPKTVVNKLKQDDGDRDETYWRLKATGNWLDGQVFTIKGKTIVGRDATCTITIPGSHLSRHHAEFIPVGARLVMRDLDSSNGSFVNGKRNKEANLVDGDEVRLDVLTFKVMAPDDKRLSPDKRKTAVNEAIKEPVETQKEADRSWVTKPTSIGNTAYDPHDILLAQHIRNKRIMYAVFGILFALLAALGIALL